MASRFSRATTQPPPPDGLSIDTVDNLNALLIRYDDPGDLAEIRSYIDTLDIPVLQVDISTKLVEVIEDRAKEWMPEFDLANITKGPDLSGGNLDGRFARYADEFRDPFDPLVENLQSAPFLKGTTVLSYSTLGESPVNFTLRAMEAEGVAKIVNGPHITVENGQTADFEITRNFGTGFVQTGGTGGNIGNTGFNNQNTVGTNQSFPTVQLSVEPQITQLGEIRLDISDLQLNDYVGQGGNETRLDINGNGALDTFEPVAIATAVLGNERRQRSIQTVCRCSDGGTIVLGGWEGESSRQSESGVPILRKIPYLGKVFFNRTSDLTGKSSLLVFLTCNIVKP